MKVHILLILITSAIVVNSQLSNFNQSILEILGNADVSNLNNYQVVNSNINDLPTLISMLDFLQYFSNIQNITQSISTDNECVRQLKLYAQQLLKVEEWALKMFDATAKLQSGILEGNILQTGHYDECLKIDVSVNGSRIHGQYCTAAIIDSIKDTIAIDAKEDLLALLLSYGFCIPAACNATYLTKLVRSVEEVLQSSSHFVFIEDFCDSTIKSKPFAPMTIVAIIFFVTMGIIIVLSTLYDIICEATDNKAVGLLIVFSLYSNGQKLFNTKKPADALGCLNGIRVISMSWIVAAHQYQYMMTMPLANLVDVAQWQDYTASVLVTAGNMAVDTFFVISGLLVVYVFLKYTENGRNVSVPMMYVHRIIRLTPPLAVVVLFTGTLVSHIGSGPFWPGVVVYLEKPCKDNWWHTLLYIQNYAHPNDACVGQTWYLAVDTQLYFLSPLLLFPLIKWPKRTILATLLITVLCCVAAFEITWLKELTPANYGLTRDVMEYLYTPTHVRATPWLFGFITGYIIFHCRSRVIKINKVVVVLMWSFSMSLMIGIMLYHERANSKAGLLEGALFNSLSRLLWAFGLSIIIFLCVTGYGGFVNKFLSSSVFTVLIRLNYNMYLLHMMVIFYMAGQARSSEFGSVVKNFYIFWGDAMITLLLSIIWTLSFESPIMALEKILFTRENRVTPSAPKILNNITVIVDEKATNSAKVQ